MLLCEVSERIPLTVELGLQTIHDDVAELIDLDLVIAELFHLSLDGVANLVGLALDFLHHSLVAVQ